MLADDSGREPPIVWQQARSFDAEMAVGLIIFSSKSFSTRASPFSSRRVHSKSIQRYMYRRGLSLGEQDPHVGSPGGSEAGYIWLRGHLNAVASHRRMSVCRRVEKGKWDAVGQSVQKKWKSSFLLREEAGAGRPDRLAGEKAGPGWGEGLDPRWLLVHLISPSLPSPSRTTKLLCLQHQRRVAHCISQSG